MKTSLALLTVWCLAASATAASAQSQIEVLHAFTPYTFGTDGGFPRSGIVQGTDGNFYGATYAGGVSGWGTIYRLTPAGQLTILHRFRETLDSDGANPASALVQATDGNFYGTTTGGGPGAEQGTVFRMSPAGDVTILHRFAGSEGRSPYALIQANDGNLWGTTQPTTSSGAVFKLTLAGTFTLVHHLIYVQPAPAPRFDSGLIQATSGMMHAVYDEAGTYKVLSISTSGSVDYSNYGVFLGAGTGKLIQATDGNFYGTTNATGDDGTVFRLSPTWQQTVLYRFSGGADGRNPTGVIQGTDGNLYGTTKDGGRGCGTAFRITTAGAFTLLYRFQCGVDGATPDADVPLLQASPGYLYGTTSLGGAGHSGVVFRMLPFPAVAAPVHVVATRLTSAVRLSWPAAEGAVTYTIKRGAAPHAEVAIATGVTATNYLDAGADPNTIYYYVVTAVGDSAMTADSIEVVSPLLSAQVPSDFDGDGRVDLAVYRPVNGTWYITHAATNFATVEQIQFGLSSDVPVPGDYDGDGLTDEAVYRPRTREWYMRQSNGSFTVVTLGAPGDIPVPGDYDGDGKTDLAVYHLSPGFTSGTWTILQSTTAYAPGAAVGRIFGGGLKDIPVPADYDGDGKTDLGVYNTLTGLWQVLYARGGFGFDPLDEQTWSMPVAGVPVTADYDGDGRADPALRSISFGASYWSIRMSATDAVATVAFGLRGDVLAPADYDRDGRTDIGVFRPSDGRWYLSTATTGFTNTVVHSWGIWGDRPIVSSAAGNAARAVHARNDLRRAVDFDGDSFADITVHRPLTGEWFVLESGTGFRSASVLSWGVPGDREASGDYDGDGRTDPTVYRPSTGTWYVLLSGANYTTSRVVTWGVNGDTPVAGDYDGDGRSDMAVFRPSTREWFILLSTGGFRVSSWGLDGDVPVPADYDGDGTTDIAVFRPSNGTWYIIQSSQGTASIVAFGLNGDVPLPGDYDGDGRADLAVYRPSASTWFTLAPVPLSGTHWGNPGDIPVPGDYDGDGLFDAAVYRISTRQWFVLLSGSRQTTALVLTWGSGGDAPVSGPR